MSQSGRYSSGIIPPSTSIEQIDGDIGFVSGTVVSFNATPTAGSTIQFNGSGTTMIFEVTDGDNNTIMGNGSGNGTITGTDNTGFGAIVFPALTTGNENAAFGMGTLNALEDGSGNLSLGQSSTAFLVSGNNNTIVGSSSALSYDSTESNNIIIGSFVNGVMGESNVLRISAATGSGQGKINQAFIHGMRGITEATADEVLINASTGQIISIPAGTTGQVLTTQGAGANPIWSTPASGSITIDGDTGSATDTTFLFTRNGSATMAGSTVSFEVFGSSTVAILTSDASGNTLVGDNTGASGTFAGVFNTGFGASNSSSLTSGNYNTSIGGGALSLLEDGEYNTAVGNDALNLIVSGDANICIGYFSGTAYTTTESNNIIIGSSVFGVVGESDVIRIGETHTECYVAGIANVSVSNKEYVTIDTSTGQLGSDSGPTSSFTWSVITADQTAAVNNGYICNKAGTLALALPAASAVGDIIEVTGINTALGWQITQAAGQQVFFGATQTTLGAAGTLTSSATRDALRIVCITADTTWQVLSVVGNISVV